MSCIDADRACSKPQLPPRIHGYSSAASMKNGAAIWVMATLATSLGAVWDSLAGCLSSLEAGVLSKWESEVRHQVSHSVMAIAFLSHLHPISIQTAPRQFSVCR